jgi:hypothetical protein
MAGKPLTTAIDCIGKILDGNLLFLLFNTLLQYTCISVSKIPH